METCKWCLGAEYVGTAGKVKRCQCLVRKLTRHAWEEAWIPPVYWPLTWDSLKSRKADADVFKEVRKFEDYPEEAMEDRAGLYLSGPAGSCKTTVAALIAMRWALMEDLKVRFVLYPDVYSAKCGDKGVLKENVDDLLVTANLLVLDEIGREPVTNTGYEQLVMDEVLRKREACAGEGGRGAVTVLTTNIPFKSIEDRYSANVKSLLHGRYLEFVLKTQDIRRDVGKRLKKKWTEKGKR